MDWLTFKFCILIWILCLSKSQSQLRNSTIITSNHLRSACMEGRPVIPPNPCNSCICFSGQVYCTNLPCPEKECINGMELPQPDECNKCICRLGKVKCSSMICIPAPLCTENQLYPAQNKCNACMCKNGFISCTNNDCVEEPMTTTVTIITKVTTRKPKKKKQCEEGSRLPGPSPCLDCICQNGNRRCKFICKPIVESRFQGSKCVAGQVIPKPNSCNTCKCVQGHILCTNHQCSIISRNASLPGEFKGRLKEINEKTILEKFDKKVPVEPFINNLSKNNDKIPHKLIHSHTYNGFHQEIKVHASHLQNDTTKLLNVLANSLDNAALASISKKLLTSNSISSNQDSQKPFNYSVDQTNQQGEGNALSAQSSKLITSGSQSNETILVFPHTEPFNGQDSQSDMSLESKHETTWKTVSAPDTLVYNNGIQILPRFSQKKNGNDYYDNSPSTITSIDPNPIIRNPAKLDRPGQHYDLPTISARDTANTPIILAQSIYPILHPEPININGSKMMYAPFSQENKQINPAPSTFEINHSELPQLRPFQLTKPRPNHTYNYTSPTPVFRPEQYELHPDDNVGQQKPSQYQFPPNPSDFYPSQGTPQQFKSKPKRIPSRPINYYYNMDVPLPAKFLNNPDQPIVSANQYKSPQFGLRPVPGLYLNPAPTNPPYPKNRISTIDSEAPQFELNSKAHHSDNLNPSQNEVKPKHKQSNSPQSQLILNPSIYYKNEYEAPKTFEENPDQDQLLTPNSIISYKHTEDYDSLHTPSESGFEKLPHKVRNKTKRYNTTHSNYEKHTSVTYVSEYDPNDSDDSTRVDHDLNEQHSGPPKYAYEHYLYDEDSQEFNISKKVDHYLNIPYFQLDQNEPHLKSIQSYLTPPGQRQNDTLHPTMTEINKYDQRDSWNITNKQFEEYLLSLSKSKQTDVKTKLKGTSSSVLPNIFAIYLHKPSKPQLVFSQDNSEKEGSEDLTHLKSNDHLPPPSQTGPPQNQNTAGVFDDQGSNNGFQYSQNAYEDPRQFKPLHKLPLPKLETPQNHQLSGLFDERGPADGVQNPFNLAENPKDKFNKSSHLDPYKSMLNAQQPKDNQHIPLYSQLGPTQNQHKPGDNYTVEDGFQYALNANEDHRELKSFYKLTPFPPGSTPNKQTPGMFDERGSPDGLRHLSYLAENPIPSRGNLHNFPPNQFGPDKKRLPGGFDDRGSAGSSQNPPSSTENSLFPKSNIQNPPHPKLDPNQNQRFPGVFDGRESTDGLHYPTKYSPFTLTQKQKLLGISDHRGSADGFHYPTNSTQKPFQPPNSPLRPAQKQHFPGVFDDHGSANGLHYLSNSAKTPFNSKNNPYKPSNSLFRPTQKYNQSGVFDDQGFADGIQYPSNSAEGPKHSKENMQKSPDFPFGSILNKPTQGTFGDREPKGGPQYPFDFAEDPKHSKVKSPHAPLGPTKHLPGIFDERGSADIFQYPSYSADNPLHSKNNQQYPSHPQFGPNQNQHLPGMFDDLGSAEGFHYASDSTEDPKHPNDNPDTTPESNFKQSQNEPKPLSLDQIPQYISKNYNDKTENQPTSNNYNNNNPVRPWMYLNYDQYKPSSFDNLFNGVHNIPWSLLEDHDKVVNTVFFTRPPRFEPDYDQYKPSSFDNLFNGLHHMPGLSIQEDNHLQIAKDNFTDLINSDSMQNNPDHRIKPDNVPDSLLPTGDDKFTDYYYQLYQLFIALKKLSEPSNGDSGLSSMDKLDHLTILFPDIADILKYNPSKEQDDEAPVEKQIIQKILPLKKLKSHLNHLPDNANRILNWLKSKLNKLMLTKDNTTETKNEIVLPKIFKFLSKLMPNKIKKSTENIPFNGFDPEKVEKKNDFKDTQTVTATPYTAETTNENDNRIHSVPTALEEILQQDTKKYPEIHIILHQPVDGENVDLLPYIKADGEAGLTTDMGSKDVHSPLFSNMFYPRLRHRPKDQKDECGDGTQWISNCHSCSCYFGQTICLRMQDCKLRPFGEPMMCKPYSHFKMGCYTCECNGDGVTKCDATDCGKEPKGKGQGSQKLALLIYHEFFDNKKTDEILQYYKSYKKLPKDCPRQNSQTAHPTCERGTSWISSCHKCECNERGKHECTKINDCVLNFDSYGKPGRCKPNSKFYPKTNSIPCGECLCNDEGIPNCPEANLKKH